jgi:hypothetical protein
MATDDPNPSEKTPISPHDSPSVPEAPEPGAIVVLGGALWWFTTARHWRVVHEDLWHADGDRIVWRRSGDPLPCQPVAWDIVFTPLRSRGVVVAVRVIRVAAQDGDVVVRGVTPSGEEIELRRNAREYFCDAVEAALELSVPPRLDAIVEFADG